MCGIVGSVGGHGNTVDAAIVLRAADALARRGPDDRGVWCRGQAGLGHRRLAIIDTSARGHQPMSSPDGRYVIVYNGEVYNFRELRKQLADRYVSWSGESDTEVVLAAFMTWGSAFLGLLRGMFALAIWDTQARKLFVARDRMGVKPLYYCVTGDRLHFASRPRALQILDSTVSREIDEQALRLYLECGFVPAPHTIHRAIRKLPPAHYLTFDETGLKITQYWDFRAIRPDRSLKQRPERELLDELDSLVSESVRLRTVSDVPLGSLLSGGIDSALVTAMLAKHSPKKIQAFTIGFDDPAFDESGPAQEIAAHLGIVHHTERLRVDDLLELMPMFREEFDEPLADSSAFPVMAVSRLARKYVTVALSGDGGDELFGGYHYYAIAKALGKAYALPEVLRSASAAILDTAGYHKAHMLAGALRQKAFPEAFAFSRSIAKDFPSVLTEDVLGGTAGIDELYRIYAAAYLSDLGNLDQAMRLDMAFTLPDDYLQKIDVGSMAFSLEGREPLLDHVLVEWAMRLPDVWKVRGFGSKYLLRRLARRYIPRTILDRPKRGFGVPMARWLRGPLTEWASDTIRRRKLYDVLPIRPKIVQGLLDLHLSGKRDVSPLLWAILVLSDFVSFDDATRS